MGKTFKRNSDSNKKIHRATKVSKKREHFELEDFENNNFNQAIMEYEYEKQDSSKGVHSSSD